MSLFSDFDFSDFYYLIDQLTMVLYLTIPLSFLFAAFLVWQKDKRGINLLIMINTALLCIFVPLCVFDLQAYWNRYFFQPSDLHNSDEIPVFVFMVNYDLDNKTRFLLATNAVLLIIKYMGILKNRG